MQDQLLLDMLYKAVQKDLLTSELDKHLFGRKEFMAIGVIEAIDLVMGRWKRQGSMDLESLKVLRDGMLRELKDEVKQNFRSAVH